VTTVDQGSYRLVVPVVASVPSFRIMSHVYLSLSPPPPHSGQLEEQRWLVGVGNCFHLDRLGPFNIGSLRHLCVETISNQLFGWISVGCLGGLGKSEFDHVQHLLVLQPRIVFKQPCLCKSRIYAVCGIVLYVSASFSL
jgi:hypothetical protein